MAAMLEGVEVAFGGAGAGSFAAPSTALRAGPSARSFDVAQGRLGTWGLLSVCQRMVNGLADGGGASTAAHGGGASAAPTD
jgi:hypothetical protein